MSFQRYPHLEKLGNMEVEGIEMGTCYVFAKLDGTNASMWNDVSDGKFGFGSRNRELSRENDNAGFMNHIQGVGFSEEEAQKVVNMLVELEHFAADVTHEPSGDTFYLGIPAAAMKDITFFAKKKD